MKTDCDVIRDLLPLYADDVCSGASRRIIEEHLPECPECAAVLDRLRTREIEDGLREEKDSVIEFQARRFRRRSATVGSVISCVFMVPVLVCLIVNLSTGAALNWFFVVLAGMAVAASLIIVPLMAAENKLFWTFCSFCVSLVVLLAVCAVYTGGSWFFIAASASLFGLSAVFLPFALRAEPARKLIGGFSRPVTVLAVDTILFANMMNMITMKSKGFLSTLFVALLCAAGAAALVFAVRNRKEGNSK